MWLFEIILLIHIDNSYQCCLAIPLKEISQTKKIAVVVTSRGGHIGFMEGMWPVKEEQYMGKLFSQFFTALFTTNLEHQLLWRTYKLNIKYIHKYQYQIFRLHSSIV